MSESLKLHDIEEFRRVARVRREAITEKIVERVRELREEEQIEKFLRQILHDHDCTPHGPTEQADILTARLNIDGRPRLAAFVLKGKSLKKVTRKDIAHQVAKARGIPGLDVIVLLAVGHIHDSAKTNLVQAARDAEADYVIVDAHEVARLFVAYEKLCPKDGTPFNDTGVCEKGHELDPGVCLEMQVSEDPRYEIIRTKDVSHGGAKRYSATVLIDRHYSRDVVREIIGEVVEHVREEDYARNDMVRARWGCQSAHVVWLFVACELEDVRHTNWYCRVQWIDNDLGEPMRPMELSADEQMDGIRIAWNDDYEENKAFYKKHSASKGQYLQYAEQIAKRMISLGEEAVEWFGGLSRR